MVFDFEERQFVSPYIETIWRTQCDHAEAFTSTSNIHWGMVVTRHRGATLLTVRGPESFAAMSDALDDAEWIGITFRSGVYMPDLLPGQLRDHQDANHPSETGRSVRLLGSQWEVFNFENADVFVDRLIRNGLLVHDPYVKPILDGDTTRLSTRAIQYRVLRATGLTLKENQQIVRAQQAAERIAHGASILDTVHEAGYFDQPHLTRALKRFMGQTPGQIARNGLPL